MEVSKVQLANGEVLIDLINDSVTEETLAEGATAHDASGVKITGKMKSGGGGVSVQSDWNQTDETAADFIKNKPFGFATPISLLYEGTDIAPEFDGEWYFVKLDIDLTYSLGQSYLITIDGVSYQTNTFDLYGSCGVGNPMLLGAGADNGLPFVSISMEGQFVFGSMDNFSSVSIASCELAKVDKAYLPTITLGDLPSQTLYAPVGEADSYLYKDTRLTEKATKYDVPKGAFSIGLVIDATYGFIAAYYTPEAWECGELVDYGEVSLGSNKYYTAEYVKETTT